MNDGQDSTNLLVAQRLQRFQSHRTDAILALLFFIASPFFKLYTSPNSSGVLKGGSLEAWSYSSLSMPARTWFGRWSNFLWFCRWVCHRFKQQRRS
jgi:hypothetical protein